MGLACQPARSSACTRIKRRMSTISLATHAGITVSYLEMIEADGKTRSIPVLRKLVRVLGVRT